ncbi:Retrovirus-related Pol polyprotein from transposon TNT 1-94 [Porphyridium purpureum]|uniref:Retrovirus-related Pol polyprotein from transposon TNT 1-94 n=1 Tax=Porphyridium purpureum TaxID=35688 RepID=A0A5J4YZ92_PORPP|nr:Retrovirus-related Pol polyprotein from transposon TNT 1-94 [Porphyridium purpureum]|eukprot:POR4527..scf208_2
MDDREQEQSRLRAIMAARQQSLEAQPLQQGGGTQGNAQAGPSPTEFDMLMARVRAELSADLRMAQQRIEGLESDLAHERAARSALASAGAGQVVHQRGKLLEPARMPAYDGKRDLVKILTWISAARDRVVEPYKDEVAAVGESWDDAAEKRVVRNLAGFLTDDAQLWWIRLREQPFTVEAFLAALEMRFAPVNPGARARDELFALEQNGTSVEEYTNTFSSLCLRIEDATESELFDKYKRGLDKDIRVQTELKGTSSLEEVIRVASEIDAIMHPERARTAKKGQTPYGDGPAPMELGSAERGGKSVGAGSGGKRKSGRKKWKARDSGRRDGLKKDQCANCKRIGHWKKDCPELAAQAAELELLTASTRPKVERLVKRKMWVNGHQVDAVFDTGATNTYASLAFCEKIGVAVDRRAAVGGVRLADGTMCRPEGTARLTLRMHGARDAKLSAVVHRARHELIVGLDWLRAQKAHLSVGGMELLSTDAEKINEKPNEPIRATEPVRVLDHDLLHMPAKEDCGICALGKIQRVRAVRRKESDSNAIIGFNEAVSIDLVDPSSVGVDGTRWVLVHKDIGTGWVSVTGLRNKLADTASFAFREIQRGRGWPRLVKSDGGGEFGGVFEDMLRDHLVAHEKGIARRSNTHASQERLHRDMNATVRALLIQSGLPSSWFCFAARYWADARNLVWAGRGGGATAYEKRFNTKWKLELPAFGRGVVVYDEASDKNEPKGSVAIVVGFRIPESAVIKQRLNCLVIPVSDMRPAAARWVQEWKLLKEKYPVVRKQLRPVEEEFARPPDPKPVADDEGQQYPGSGRNDKSDETGETSETETPADPREKSNEIETGFKECVRANGTEAPPTGPLATVDGRSRKGSWSSEQIAAISGGFTRLGPKWSQIIKESKAALAGKTAKDVRSKAQALGLLGSQAQGLGEHRRGRSGALRRARVKFVEVAEKGVSARAEKVSVPLAGATALVQELLVTQVIESKSAMASSAGRDAFVRELTALRSVGALPLEKAVERRTATRTPHAQFVKLKAVFGIKNAELGPSAWKHKCRLVCQGCVVRDATGTLVVNPFDWEKPPGLVAIRAALSAALLEHGEHADAAFFDVDNAYVHAPLGGPPTFVELAGLTRWLRGCIPSSLSSKLEAMERPVVRLPMALYGLPRSGSDFGAHARSRLEGLGWKESASDKNVYWRKRLGKTEWTVLYVDDGAVFGDSGAIREAVAEMKKEFSITRAVEYMREATKENPVRFLGIGFYVDKDMDGAWVMSSREYARHMLADGQERQARKTPMSCKPEPDRDGEVCDKSVRRTLGRILWLVRTTRPDLAFAVGTVARCTDRWGEEAEKGLNDIMRYLQGSADAVLVFRVPPLSGAGRALPVSVSCYTDADFSAERSTSGVCTFFVGKNTRHLVDWSSGRQRRTATSTAEAELIAAHTAVQYRVFPLGVFIEEWHNAWPKVAMYVDNETALNAINKGWSDKMLHLHKMQKISLKWLNEVSKDGLADFVHVNSKDNLADGLTKNLAVDSFQKQRHGWCVV